MSVERIPNPERPVFAVTANKYFWRLLATAAMTALAMPVVARGQPTFSIDFQGPTIAVLDSFGSGIPISEGDILVPGTGFPVPGPGLPPPGIGATAGFTGVFFVPDLGLPAYIPGGSAPGIPGLVEVDALSYGVDFLIDPAAPPHEILYNFSVDEFAVGFATGFPPEVATEGGFGATDASADIYVYFPPGACPPLFPAPPFACPPGNTLLFDGDGIAPPFVGPVLPLLPPAPPGFFFGIGLIEPNFPTPVFLPDPGDNLDALDMDTMGPPLPFPVYFSLDSSFPDPLEPFPPANSGSALAQGLVFVGGDVLVTPVPGGPPMVFAPAFLVGLDVIGGPDTDDLDALALVENGTGVYEPSVFPFDWVPPGPAIPPPTDMLLFSVRRGSFVIGAPDSCFGIPITEGDILTTPVPPALGGLSPFPCIFQAAENLGLATLRSGFPTGSGLDDELDALDIARDCDATGVPDLFDVFYGTAPDCNGNLSPDSCDFSDGISMDCQPNGIPDECEPDCQGNGIPDDCDIASGASADCQPNGIPDECEPDCQGNGIPDDCDIASGASADCQPDGIPDECQPNSAFADLDMDGDVDGVDFLTFSNCFNGSLNPPKPACANGCADIDHDGDVDGVDFLTFSNCFNGSLNPPKPC